MQVSVNKDSQILIELVMSIPEDRHGYMFMINGCPVSFRSNKKASAEIFSCEAEVIASNLATTEAVWLGDDVSEFGFSPQLAFTLYKDKVGPLSYSLNKINHSKMEHIALREIFITEQVANGTVVSKYMPSAENVAEIFTKALWFEKNAYYSISKR